MRAKERFVVISPLKESFEVKGRLRYKETVGAWSVIRLKKEIIQEYPQLKKRRESFGYNMKIFTSYKEIKKMIREREKNCEPLPILLDFCKRIKGENSPKSL